MPKLKFKANGNKQSVNADICPGGCCGLSGGAESVQQIRPWPLDEKFCEDEGYDYWKFCRLAREGQTEMTVKSGENGKPGFIEINPDGTQSQVVAEEPMKVCEIRFRFNNGLVLSRKCEDLIGLSPCYCGL